VGGVNEHVERIFQFVLADKIGTIDVTVQFYAVAVKKRRRYNCLL
jgi:hypothetical protein